MSWTDFGDRVGDCSATPPNTCEDSFTAVTGSANSDNGGSCASPQITSVLAKAIWTYSENSTYRAMVSSATLALHSWSCTSQNRVSCSWHMLGRSSVQASEDRATPIMQDQRGHYR